MNRKKKKKVLYNNLKKYMDNLHFIPSNILTKLWVHFLLQGNSCASRHFYLSHIEKISFLFLSYNL